MQHIFDGHNDLLLRLWMEKDYEAKLFIDGGKSILNQKMNTAMGIGNDGHIDLARASVGGLSGGFFAMFVPDPNMGKSPPKNGFIDSKEIKQDYALRVTLEMLDIIENIINKSNNKVQLILNKSDFKEEDFKAETYSTLKMLIHIEGAECIDGDLNQLDTLYSKGLRSIGPVWSRSNVFAHGVPFDFPGTPDTGPGLTDQGKNLVQACNSKGIMIDLSHLNEAGFWDVAKISSKPLVATHSNSHKITPSPRNLTDKQLAAVAESGGVVGLNFATGFLRSDGKKVSQTPLTQMIAHLDHLLEKLGENGVALGSDFDGAQIPEGIKDCAGLPNLIVAMKSAGYGEDLINKICYKNWHNLIHMTIN
jgi:membrane dipeptidase